MLLTSGLVLFLGVHLVPAVPPLRAALAGALGGRYRAAFSVASALGLVAIVAGYADAHSWRGVRLFDPVPAAVAVAPAAMVVAFVLFAAANLRGHVRRALGHPMLLGLLLWSLVHLLANGDLRGTVLFGAFLAYAVVDLVSALARGAVKAFEPAAKFDAIAIVGGTAVALVVMALHRVLFGVPVVAFSV